MFHYSLKSISFFNLSNYKKAAISSNDISCPENTVSKIACRFNLNDYICTILKTTPLWHTV